MRILVLDDSAERHNIFSKIYYRHEVVHTYTYHEFCIELDRGPWDLIHLDHDLGADSPYIDGWGHTQEYNGGHAAMRICAMDYPPNKVIIHSLNTVGARGMLQALKRCGIDVSWEPFRDTIIYGWGEPNEV